jgi:ribosomal-protein-serine acetyltransferase
MAIINSILLDLPTELQTDRLNLRGYRAGDGPMYFQAVQENIDHLYEFLPPNVLEMKNEADAEVILRKFIAEWHLRNLFLFGAWHKETQAYIGETYLANADWHVPCIEVGYFLLKDYTGKGYATEACRAAIRFAFEHLKVIRVELQCSADNQASQRVAERCGFALEGCFRNRHRKKTGDVIDRLWYGLLREEWQAGQPPSSIDKL